MIEEIRTNCADPKFDSQTSGAEGQEEIQEPGRKVIKMEKYPFSENGIRFFLADIFRSAWKISGNEAAARSTDAVAWYVNTGRASSEFVRAMLKHRPSTIARRCLIGGSDQEIIDRIKNLLECGNNRTPHTRRTGGQKNET